MLRVLAAFVVSLVLAGPALAREEVAFRSADGTAILALFMKPAGPGPFPAIVALHGCGGLRNDGGALFPRHRDWAERLVAQGFAVLMPESFRSRGTQATCTQNPLDIRPGRERVADVHGARTFLQAREDIVADRITLFGWSNGASTILWAIRPNQRPDDGRPDFRRAIAFYPGCRMAADRRLTPRIPLLILAGEDDDWTPAGPCEDYVAHAKGRGLAAEIVLYTGALHGFDAPNQPVRTLEGLAQTADGSGRARTGTDPAARLDSIRRVSEFLSR